MRPLISVHLLQYCHNCVILLPSDITEEFKQKIVDGHNDLRAQVNPPAAYMMKLVSPHVHEGRSFELCSEKIMDQNKNATNYIIIYYVTSSCVSVQT